MLNTSWEEYKRDIKVDPWDILWQRPSSVEDIVKLLQLDQKKCALEREHDNLVIAMHELVQRDTILWGLLDGFLRLYLRVFPFENQPPLTEKELEDCFKVAFDERTLPLTRYILVCELDGRGPRTLSDLAERRYPKESPNFHKFRRAMIEKVICPMRDLKLWTFEIIWDTSGGKKRLKCYQIGAGPALLDFHRYVYLPLREKQLKQFIEAHYLN
jgi:hypothetical protein